MIAATQAGADRTILLAEFMAPILVLGKGSGGKSCRRYPVMVSASNGTQTRMILLEYGCGGNTLHQFETAVSTLNRLQNMSIQMPRHWVYGNHPEHRYILIDADPQDCLSLRELAKKPLRDRLDILCGLLEQAAALQEQGILLREPSWSQIRYQDGQHRFWDYTGALLHRDVTETVWTKARYAANASMAKLVYQGILGRDLPTADLRPNLTILLCHMADSDDLSAFCDTMEGCLFRTEDPGLERLLEDLYILREFGSEPGQKNTWEPWQIVADFLYRNPLYPYVRKNDSSDSLLKVVLFGRSELREAFFSQILSAAQILDNRLHLHIIAPDAAEFWTECRSRSPLLEQVIRVNGDGSTLEPEITGHNSRGEVTPLAELTLEAADQLSSKALCQDGTGCLLLLEPYNDTVSLQICDLVNRTEKRLLVGICQDRPLGETTIGKKRLTDLRSFRSGSTSRFEDTEIYQKALGVHTYYEKHYDQRIPHERSLEDFHCEKGDHYSLRSSVRSALSIPYKLCSDEPDLARFHREILEKKDKLLYRLIWLEHRSWQAHLILDGWRLNPDDFGGGLENKPFAQKNEQEKWHACLRGSDDTGYLPLDVWNWENGDLSGLDALDRMSIEIHRRLDRKASRHQADLDACLARHRDKLKSAQYQQVKNSVNQLRQNVTNAEVGWSRTCDELGWNKAGDTLDPDTINLLSLVQELVDRNARRDYKKIDQSIIEAIPYLERQKPIQHIYSLCAEHPWHNVAAAMLLEPETLTLLTDPQHDVHPDALVHCVTFLRDRRNLKTEVSILELAELEQPLSDAVLDVTGADADQILAVTGHELLRKLPLIAYQNGSLTCLRGERDDLGFYPQYHSITVEEMMSLTGTKVLSEYSEIPMHGMSLCKELWSAIQTMTLSRPDHYNKLCSLIRDKLHNQQLWRVHNQYLTWESRISEKIALASGFSRLLEQLKAQGLIGDQSNHAHVELIRTDFCEQTSAALDEICKRLKETEPLEDFGFQLERIGDHWRIRVSNGPFIQICKETRTPWVTAYTKAKALKIGLLPLLLKLQGQGIIDPFEFPDTAGPETRIFACIPKCQDELNILLDAYANAITLGTWKDYHLNVTPEDPAILCELEDRSLLVQKKAVYSEKGNKVKFADGALEACFGILENQKLIKQIEDDPILVMSAKGVKSGGKDLVGTFTFQYADYAVRDCLTKEGNALEALVYHTIRNMNIFDDVKLGVCIQWDRQHVRGWDTRNEIDIICTKGMKSWFISCKMTSGLDKKALTEIRYETDRFGVDGIPILVTTAVENGNNQSAYNQAKRMGVHVITLTKEPFRKDSIPDSTKELEDQLRAILKKA